MDAVHILLSKRWILRSQSPEMYYQLKDKHHEYIDFFKQKLGYNIIINPLLIKAEKIPGASKAFMGIQEMNDSKAYVFLCLILMYLEEKDTGEQFVLSQIIDYVKNQYPDEAIDWTIYSNRKLIIQVLRYCIEEGLIIINDGDDKNFSDSADAVEVLYENTGVSKYFMRRFPFDINQVDALDDFFKLEWQMAEVDRGLIRRQRVYRRLFMEPIVYDTKEDDQDYLYIKNMRSVLLNDTEKYLDGDFHLHKNGALILLKESSTHTLPNRKNISDIVIQFCTLLQDTLSDAERNDLDQIVISKNKWDMYSQQLKDKYSPGWSKRYREMTITQLKGEINPWMETYGMIETDHHDIFILPMVGKIRGNYSKEFWEKHNG